MAVVFYRKKPFTPGPEQKAKLLYVCKADSEQTVFPCMFHMHEDHLEMLYFYQGRGDYIIGERHYEVRAGDLAIYNSGMLHDERADAVEGLGFYNCGIKGFSLPDLPPNHLIADDVSPVVHLGDAAQTVEALFRLMHEQVVSEEAGTAGVCHYLLPALLILLKQQATWEKLHERSGRDEEIFNKFKLYIDDNFTEELRIDEAARQLHCSVSSLSHQFKKRMGMPPVQYITRRRIGKAQWMLMHTDDSITDIGLAVGYDNLSYFNNLFKKMVGMSPQSYRKYWVGDGQFKRLDALHGLWHKL